MPPQALLAEHVVAVLDRERALPHLMSAAAFNEAVVSSLAPVDRPRFKPITAAQLASVRALRQALDVRWRGLAPGTTLEVEFPARFVA